MSDSTWDRNRRLEELFEQALDLDPSQWPEFAAQHCADDEELRHKLLGLLNRREMLRQEGAPAFEISQDTNTRFPFQPDPQQSGNIFELAVGSVFGPFVIVSQVGHGGMGAVYLAREPGRRVALKVMAPTRLNESNRIRFEQEARTLAMLEHANIARLYSSGIATTPQGDRPYFAMEYIDGKTLDEYLAETVLDQNGKLELLRKICLGVQHGHEKTIIHRDLKPSNIMVGPDGEPKIVDFGVARVIEAGAVHEGETQLATMHTAADIVVGTLSYMAPEVAGGKAAEADARSDVYSLGVIAFEMFTGRRPFALAPDRPPVDLRQQSPLEVRIAIRDFDRELLGSADRRLRGDLEKVIEMSLHRDPAMRYADAGAMADDIKRLLSDQPILAQSPSTWYRTKKFVRRHRAIVLGTIATVMALVIGLVAVSILLSRTRAAYKELKQKQEEARRNDAAHHASEAKADENRGNWTEAADEFALADQAGFPDKLLVAVGELRALDRAGRLADTSRYIQHIHEVAPQIASSPSFQFEEGVIRWSDGGKGQALLRTALLSPVGLSSADRAFGDALITPDVPVAAADLEQAVREDPFNHQARALLIVIDLVSGHAVNAEQDANFLMIMFPEDHTAPALASVGAAFQGNRERAMRYLRQADNLSPRVKSLIAEFVTDLCNFHTYDDYIDISFISKIRLAGEVMNTAQVFAGNGKLIVPESLAEIPLVHAVLANESVTNAMSKSNFVQIKGFASLSRVMETITRPASKEKLAELDEDLAAPSLVDCRRVDLSMILPIRYTTMIALHEKPEKISAAAHQDAKALIDAGGLRLDLQPGEKYDLEALMQLKLFDDTRQLAAMSMNSSPKDPVPVYYAAQAELSLGHRDLAQAFAKRAVDLGGDAQAKALLAQLQPPATQASSGP